jgi:hypothetical protein
MDEPHFWGWTSARRARQAEAIRQWRPWLRSTGPITLAGKAVASKNAIRDDPIAQELAAITRQLREVAKVVKKIEAKRRRG